MALWPHLVIINILYYSYNGTVDLFNVFLPSLACYTKFRQLCVSHFPRYSLWLGQNATPRRYLVHLISWTSFHDISLLFEKTSFLSIPRDHICRKCWELFVCLSIHVGRARRVGLTHAISLPFAITRVSIPLFWGCMFSRILYAVKITNDQSLS